MRLINPHIMLEQMIRLIC